MPPDFVRIAFVTRRFADLQGLRSASLGAALIFGVVSWTLLSGLSGGFRNPSLHIALLAQVVLLALRTGLDDYYDRSFGRVPSGSTALAGFTRTQWSQPGGRGPAVVLVGMFLDALKGDSYPGGISLGAAALTAYSVWVLIRDWPHRVQHSIGVAAGVAGIVVFSKIPVVQRTVLDPVDPAIGAYVAVTYALLGLGFLSVGLLDHRLLVGAMSAQTSGGPAPSTLDPSLCRLRVIVPALFLVVLFAYCGFAGWPQHALGIYLAMYFGFVALLVVESFRAAGVGFEHRRFYSELTRAREARLLATFAVNRGEEPKAEVEPPLSEARVPRFDFLGNLVLPIAMACGALVDVGLRESGLPSFLALALAASHLRIAVRDWPSRAHYLLGVIAASISAVHFIFVPHDRALDWTLWFLILVCAAMIVEGLLDYRLTRTTGPGFSKERHADAI